MFEQAFKNIDDVLWKEAGCTTELDYTEQTSWLLFLKYLDGLEQDKADEAALEAVRVATLGKKGSVSALLATMGSLTPDERKLQGPKFNGLRDTVTEAIAARKAESLFAAPDVLVVGFGLSFLCGLLAVAFMVRFLRTHSLVWFVPYRLLVAVFAIYLALTLR